MFKTICTERQRYMLTIQTLHKKGSDTQIIVPLPLLKNWDNFPGKKISQQS